LARTSIRSIGRRSWTRASAPEVALSSSRRACPSDTSGVFRRSWGLPAIIHLAYGLIAASVAELTEGIITSWDGAWDRERFPATADECLSWYFRPSSALTADNREWAQTCLRALAEELAVSDPGIARDVP
jgi:hypothetical protein